MSCAAGLERRHWMGGPNYSRGLCGECRGFRAMERGNDKLQYTRDFIKDTFLFFNSCNKKDKRQQKLQEKTGQNSHGLNMKQTCEA